MRVTAKQYITGHGLFWAALIGKHTLEVERPPL
jgi:hypothetical protein